MGRISLLELRIVELENNLAPYENPESSGNSSIPPSKDENRPKKTQSLRVDSDRKSGGQPSHTGHALEMKTNPDAITDHITGFCSGCGHDLWGISAELSSKRQVFDIPMIKPVCAEHRSYHKTCPCGEKNKAAYPAHVNAPVQYGSGVESLITYLDGRQYLPYNRLKELLKDCFGINLSEGSIDNIIRRFAQTATPVYEKLKNVVAQSAVIGCDGTGVKVDGNKHWIWAYQSEKFTVLAMSKSLGLQSTTSHFQDGPGKAILCHDACRTYFHYSQNRHQLCCAHMLRALNYMVERYKSTGQRSSGRCSEKRSH